METIYISTTVGERLLKVVSIVGDALVNITSLEDNALVEILANEERWCEIKELLLTS